MAICAPRLICFSLSSLIALIAIESGLFSNVAIAASTHEPKLESILVSAYLANSKIKKLEAKRLMLTEKSEAAGYWPDPIVSGNYFLRPIQTRLGAQTSNFMISQKIPFPGKLAAKEDQSEQEARVIAHQIKVVKLELELTIKSIFYEAYVLKKRLSVNRAEVSFLENLSRIALANIRVGKAGQQDVTQATLEISRLAQDSIEISQNLRSMATQINTILDRPPDSSVEFFSEIKLPLALIRDSKGWKRLLKSTQADNPMIKLVSANVAAGEAGLRYAKIHAIPDINISFSWMRIDESTAPSPSLENEDAYAIGASISVPIWWGKHRSMTKASVSELQSANDYYQETLRGIEGRLADNWQLAATSKELIKIFRNTVLPQANQILLANRSAYQQGSVSFDRVVNDFRRLLNIKVKFFKEEARFMTAVAKIENVLGRPIEFIGSSTPGGISR